MGTTGTKRTRRSKRDREHDLLIRNQKKQKVKHQGNVLLNIGLINIDTLTETKSEEVDMWLTEREKAGRPIAVLLLNEPCLKKGRGYDIKPGFKITQSISEGNPTKNSHLPTAILYANKHEVTAQRD